MFKLSWSTKAALGTGLILWIVSMFIEIEPVDFLILFALFFGVLSILKGIEELDGKLDKIKGKE